MSGLVQRIGGVSRILLGVLFGFAFSFANSPDVSSAQTAQAESGSSGSSDTAKNWDQWRGPGRDGKVHGKSWPASLKPDRLKESWSAKLGPSYSGPIVTEKHVFVTETANKKDELVICFDRKSGEKLWAIDWAGAMDVPFFAKANGSWIRSTPAYADGMLYVGGIRDVLVCIDVNQGQVVWRKDFPEIMGSPIPMFGCVCSPLIDGDFVYMQAGGAMHKLNRLTGESIWQSAQDGAGKNSSVFSSPAIGTIAGQRQLLVQGREELMGVDLDSGKILWAESIPAFRGMNIITPTLVGNAFFISNYQNPTMMLSIDRSDEGEYLLSQLWKNRSRGYMTTPVIVDGHAYTYLQSERFACVELATGEEKWRSEKNGKYANLVANGNQILALTSKGDLVLINANPKKYEEIDRRSVANDAWAHLAVRGDQLFVRALDKLIVFDWK